LRAAVGHILLETYNVLNYVVSKKFSALRPYYPIKLATSIHLY